MIRTKPRSASDGTREIRLFRGRASQRIARLGAHDRDEHLSGTNRIAFPEDSTAELSRSRALFSVRSRQSLDAGAVAAQAKTPEDVRHAALS